MKIAALSKIIGAGVLAFSLTALPVSAQTTTTPDSGTTTTQPTVVDDDVDDRDDDSNWGWLGLIGLAGLLGLAGRKKKEPTAYRDPDRTVGSTTYRE
ncbi:WGxxGxxG-CTERM domain-containing protein [Chroococcidiopsis sp. FACHB-1243]|uniref:WGxxGxxG family protein n=1 Tax=Chroococcidiopsis sp. [FACHB-1243] TaxID=2692781 RepID=UPI001782ABAF|nr:WGxxGxxG-CTERM domain-containing protein [Chroococcidiopsis sp. [FACHB-1243]]